MRTVMAMAALAALASPAFCADDEHAKKVAEQKKQAEAAWKSLEAGDFATVETKHLLVYGAKSLEKQLKAKATLLESYHDKAAAAAGLDPKEGYPGKITVYLLGDRDQVRSFALRVEKRRLPSGESSSFKAEDNMLHAAAGTGGKGSVESKAGEMLAALILARKAGRGTQLPDWLLAGFGRATSYQVSPKEKFVLDDRKQVKALAKKKDASDVWDGKLEPEEVESMQGSLAEFMAYGPGKKYFPKLLAGYAPGEGKGTKTTPQALEEAGLTAEKVVKAWKNWVK
jgi:hypothetical protein